MSNLNEGVILDIEVYPNYFLASFKSLRTNKIVKIETSTTVSREDAVRLRKILNKTTIGFNSWRYDIPILMWVIKNKPDVHEIYKKSKSIIEGDLKPYTLYNMYSNPENLNHVDISEPSPAVMVSLKGYGARIGSKKLWDLPYDPHTYLNDKEKKIVSDYCVNDLETTFDLFTAIYGRLELRQNMSEEYGIDLMSKSDAQIAESVFVSELEYDGKAPTLPLSYSIKYTAPDCVRFENEKLLELFDKITATSFTLNKAGQVSMPKHLSNTKIVIGETTYKIGIGGLHSQEKKMVVKSNDTHVLRNADVASYYPSMILEFKWSPKQFGARFLSVYREIYNTRLKAKAEGIKTVNEGLKIVLNGSFGKLGSKYSKLYSPDLMLHVTLTGQLMLLMLIERLEKQDIKVVSSNTDGVEYLCDRSKVDLAEMIIFDWELETGMVMEHGEYKALYARDVNNYIAIYDGYTKAKGIFVESSLMKGRQCPIVFTAIREYLLNGIPIEQTIKNEKDINEFVLSRTVKGGGVWKEEYLGKMVRWYWSKDGQNIAYKSNGNKVPLSDKCNPIMDFHPDNRIPLNLDYSSYIEYTVRNLESLGVDYVAEK